MYVGGAEAFRVDGVEEFDNGGVTNLDGKWARGLDCDGIKVLGNDGVEELENDGAKAFTCNDGIKTVGCGVTSRTDDEVVERFPGPDVETFDDIGVTGLAVWNDRTIVGNI